MHIRPHGDEYVAQHQDSLKELGDHVDRLVAAPWATEFKRTAAGVRSINQTAGPVGEVANALLTSEYAAPGLETGFAKRAARQVTSRSAGMVEEPVCYPYDSLGSIARLPTGQVGIAIEQAAFFANTNNSFVTVARTRILGNVGVRSATGYSIVEENSGLVQTTQLAVVDGMPYAASAHQWPVTNRALFWRIVKSWSLANFFDVGETIMDAACQDPRWEAKVAERSKSKRLRIIAQAVQEPQAEDHECRLAEHKTLAASVMGAIRYQAELISASDIPLDRYIQVPDGANLSRTQGVLSTLKVP